jgi:hypothetical protein
VIGEDSTVSVSSIRRPLVALAVLAALVGMVSACTRSTPGAGPTQTVTSTITHSPSSGPTGPVSTALITAVTVSSCPYLGQQSAANNSGMRLDKITELRQDGKTVGCRFYALEHPGDGCDEVCLKNERLPPADQPAVEIIATKYRTAGDAYNAFVRLGSAGTLVEQDQVESGNTGLCFETNFWPHDKGTDWACAFSKGTTMVLIKTVVIGSSLDVVEIARAVAPKF